MPRCSEPLLMTGTSTGYKVSVPLPQSART